MAAQTGPTPLILRKKFEFASTVAFVVCGSIGSFQAEKTIEIQLVRPTEVCGKV